MTVDRDLLDALRATARRFAEREVVPMVGTELRDGDLAQVPALLAKAASIGLLAAPGFDVGESGIGIWAASGGADGDEVSAALLEEVAVECAGFAACLHHAGLAQAELGGAGEGAWPTGAVGLFDRGWRAGWQAFLHPPVGAVRLCAGRLSGAVGPVPSAPGTAAFVIYAAGPEGWQRALVMRDAAGLVCADAGPRTGLAALDMVGLGFPGAGVAISRQLHPRPPVEYVRRLCLGLAAIALGNARGGLRASQRYAEERHQGGSAIGRYATVRLLIGESRARLAAASAHLAAAAAPGPAAAWRAVAARLQVPTQCLRAVSACLQVLGGYGYIEDYRLEKRLRDAMTLAGSGIDANALRLMCAEPPEIG